MGFPKERGGSHVPESPFPPRTLPEADLPASLHTRSTPGHIAPPWAPSPWELHPLNSAKLRADSGFPPVQGFPCSCCEAEPQSCTALSHLLPAHSEASEPRGQKIKKSVAAKETCTSSWSCLSTRNPQCRELPLCYQ